MKLRLNSNLNNEISTQNNSHTTKPRTKIKNPKKYQTQKQQQTQKKQQKTNKKNKNNNKHNNNYKNNKQKIKKTTTQQQQLQQQQTTTTTNTTTTTTLQIYGPFPAAFLQEDFELLEQVSDTAFVSAAHKVLKGVKNITANQWVGRRGVGVLCGEVRTCQGTHTTPQGC